MLNKVPIKVFIYGVQWKAAFVKKKLKATDMKHIVSFFTQAYSISFIW